MGLTKSEIFTDAQNEIATLAKAFAHPARVAILHQLFKSDTCICGDLVNEIGLAQATISQHLRELKSIGIIKGTIEGTSVCYCIDTDNWKRIKSVMSAFLNNHPNPTNCC
ncbi:winged helix-turn-helix transcriptional regulator [Winogradskyella sp. DF17]|uniref:Winged helix-turn-helix transcriptional regulator n=1 Tax=Winogradskyella pelagia TaxID=2819984 RepID=A0ABS3T1C4_9FLAO|nr:metalloregulator ArsR/SmtB family transcription factor [Winogradskyella sp. DF17]MBO3116551.1 winged helix-turn-helix transcriptional regulator [Winogradskyella sp. DF17]